MARKRNLCGDVRNQSVGETYPFIVYVEGDIHTPGARRYAVANLHDENGFDANPARFASYAEAAAYLGIVRRA